MEKEKNTPFSILFYFLLLYESWRHKNFRPLLLQMAAASAASAAAAEVDG
jgi:hypothetical protein